MISGNDSIIILLSCGTLVNHIWSRMTAQQSILRNMSKLFSWCSLRCIMAFARAFTTKQQVVHTHCTAYYDKGMAIMMSPKSQFGSPFHWNSFVIVHNAACTHVFSWLPKLWQMSMKIMQLKVQNLETWTKAILTCFTKLNVINDQMNK